MTRLDRSVLATVRALNVERAKLERLIHDLPIREADADLSHAAYRIANAIDALFNVLSVPAYKIAKTEGIWSESES